MSRQAWDNIHEISGTESCDIASSCPHRNDREGPLAIAEPRTHHELLGDPTAGQGKHEFRGMHASVSARLVWCAAAPLFWWAAPAAAYSTGTLATDPCHERMTQHALRALRRDVAQAAPSIRPSADEKALLEDLPFDMPGDLADLEAATLILANRDLDLGGVSSGDLTRIAVVQADPDLQVQNCLRRAEHDEPNGARQALDACREFHPRQG